MTHEYRQHQQFAAFLIQKFYDAPEPHDPEGKNKYDNLVGLVEYVIEQTLRNYPTSFTT